MNTTDLGDIIISIAIAGYYAALVPGILENRRIRRGWGLLSCSMNATITASVSIGLLILAAPYSALLELGLAVLWTVLAIQSKRWGR